MGSAVIWRIRHYRNVSIARSRLANETLRAGALTAVADDKCWTNNDSSLCSVCPEISASRLSNSILFVSWLLLFCVVVCLLLFFSPPPPQFFLFCSLYTHIHGTDQLVMHTCTAHVHKQNVHIDMLSEPCVCKCSISTAGAEQGKKRDSPCRGMIQFHRPMPDTA